MKSEASSLKDLRRLRALALEVGVPDDVTPFSDGAECGEEGRRNATIQIGERILLKLAERQAALPSNMDETGDRLAPALIGLEQLSWVELKHLDALAERARAAARITVDALPTQWQVQCRITMATAVPSLMDLQACESKHLVSRLRRRLAADSKSLCRSVARELHRELLVLLIDAVDSLYPLACAADEIQRAAQYSASSKPRGAAPASLVARLAARRQQWQNARELLAASAESSEPDFDVGALSNALGVAVMTSALASDPLAGSSLEELRTAVRDTAHDAVRQAWESAIRWIYVAVDERVSEGFADLQRDIDDWFSELQRCAALRCGGPMKSDDKDRAVRVEVLEILRQSERLPA